jgi:hypothetical protein
MRSYQGYYTRSHQNSEVKRLWAGIVLGWVTSWEVPVLHPTIFFTNGHFIHTSALERDRSFYYWVLDMNTRFKVFASYNILQYLCDFIHVLIFVTVSKCRKSPKLTNIVILHFDND